MSFQDSIARKRDGLPLSRGELRAFSRGAADGSIPDFQLAAMLMAIRLNGLTAGETVDLTLEMARSGSVLRWPASLGPTADKHSTGGVGDGATLVLVPLVASLGLPVAKLTGSALGHTGGTLDKLSAIPGMTTALSPARFQAQVAEIGCALSGQSADLCPADRALYALRGSTATVDSLPLIVSSIVSKKLAAGCSVVVLDVKTGPGALLPDPEQTLRLAGEMVRIGCRAGARFCALMTDMSQPLGACAGNALEVREALRVLRGEEAGPLLRVSLALGARMLLQAGRVPALEEGYRLLEEALRSGRGLAAFRRLIRAQGGDDRVAEDETLLPQPEAGKTLAAGADGFVAAIDPVRIGRAAGLLGAARETKLSPIDLAAGIELCRRVGDPVRKGEPLMRLCYGRLADLPAAEALARSAVRIEPVRAAPPPLLAADIRWEGGDLSILRDIDGEWNPRPAP